MSSKKARKPARPPLASPTVAATASDADKKKAEGDAHFAKKEFTKALAAYDAALKTAATPDAVAALRAARAGALLLTGRHREAANECDAALEAVPNHAVALSRRARAKEGLGQLKAAAADAARAARCDPASAELAEAERRLKELVGRRPGAGGGGAGPALPPQPAQPRPVTTTVTLPDGSALDPLALHPGATYAELQAAVRARAPAAWPFRIEAGGAALGSRADVAAALARARGSGGLALSVVSVASEADVPPVPADEAAALQAAMEVRNKQLEKLRQVLAANDAANANGATQPAASAADLDAWMLDFAALFRDKLGVDADRPLDVQGVAWDKVQAALDAATTCDDAPALFEAAADKFTEGAAASLIQAGNALVQLGVRTLSRAVADKGAAAAKDKAVKQAADKAFSRADAKYGDADRLTPGHHDVLAARANLEFERGKAAAGLAVPPAAPLGDGAPADSAARDAAAAAAANAALHAAMSALTPADVKAADAFFKKAWQLFEKAEAAVPAADRGKKQPPPPADGAAPEDAGPWANIVVMWGNALYEQSQLRAATGAKEADWRGPLDAATAKFRDAGCPEADVVTALRAHVKAGELDLPPEEEEAAAKKTEAKGLPSLDSKKKKTAEA